MHHKKSSHLVSKVVKLITTLFKDHPNHYTISEMEMWSIQRDFLNASFRFSNMFRLFIPKPNKPGKLRPITVPFVKDRIVMDAISQVLNEVFADICLECSHGFRKGRGTQTFLAAVQDWGEVDHVIQADIVGCFDNLNHQGLIQALNQYIDDPRFLNLIHTFLTTDIKDKDGKSYAAVEKGVPQGSSLSPVLMNVFLHQFDMRIQREFSKICYARYADDLLFAIKPSFQEAEAIP